jgi:hypothetical protein
VLQFGLAVGNTEEADGRGGDVPVPEGSTVQEARKDYTSATPRTFGIDAPVDRCSHLTAHGSLLTAHDQLLTACALSTGSYGVHRVDLHRSTDICLCLASRRRTLYVLSLVGHRRPSRLELS